MTVDMMEQRWKFMSPWCKPVYGLLSLDVMKVEQLPCAGVMVRSKPSELRGIRDALVLLSLLAKVDYDAFKLVTAGYCDLDIQTELIDSDWEVPFHPERMLLLLGICAPNRSSSPWKASTFLELMNDLDTQPIPEFTAAIYSILRCSKRKIDEYLALEIVTSSTYDSNQVLTALLSLHAKYGGWRFPVNLGQQAPETKCAFAIDSIDMTMDGGGIVGGVAEQVGQLATSSGGLTLARLAITDMNEVWNSRDDLLTHLLWFGRLVRQVYCGGQRSSFNTPTVDDAVILFPNSHVHFFSRICTAIAQARVIASSGLRVPNIPTNDILNNWTWQCLAFAFFSDYARVHSSVTHVHLEGVLIDEGNVAAVAKVLASKDPVDLLFNQQSNDEKEEDASVGTPDAQATVIVKKGATVTLMPTYPEEQILSSESTFVLDEDIPDSVLLSASFGKSRVLLPGYGVCEITDDNAVKNESGLGNSSQKISEGVKYLSIKFSDEVHPSTDVSGLIALVGSQLTRLELEFPDLKWMPTTSTPLLDVAHILSSCSKLTALIIRGVDIDTGVFLRAIDDLQVRLTELRCRFTDENRIVEELSNHNSRLARYLKIFEYRCTTGRTSDANGFIEMMGDNSTLKHIDYHVPFRVRNDIERAEGEENGRKSYFAFPLACRLAFLSVFEADNRAVLSRMRASWAMPPNKITTLPREVLSSIFAFAADRIFRCVREVEGAEDSYYSGSSGNDNWSEYSDVSEPWDGREYLYDSDDNEEVLNYYFHD